MSSIVSAFNDAYSDKLFLLKVVLYSVPVYISYNLFISGKMNEFYILGALTTILVFSVLTNGINSVRANKQEILTLNPLKIVIVLGKLLLAVVPQILLWFFIGNFITKKVVIPQEFANADLIFNIIVWTVVCSIVVTSYLSFAKYLEIKDAYNYKNILFSCVDVLASVIFFVPQIIIVNLFIIGPFAYAFWLFNIPFEHWGFVLICSLAFVINISITANYFAQVAYEYIILSNDKKDDFQITKLIETMDNEKNN